MRASVSRRAVLLSFILLCAVVESPSPARAAPDAPPVTMHGFLRYKVRGLTGVSGGFLAGMFQTQGMYFAAAHRVMPGLMKILGGMAKFSNDPSMAEMHDFLRSGGPALDLSTLPVSAGRDVEIEFTLEQVKKDEFRLKRGSARWSSDTYVSFQAGEAEISDKYRGQGSGPLDLETSSITLVISGKQGARRGELNVDVRFPGGVDGKSILRNGPMAISIELRGKQEIWEIRTPFGFNNREVKEGSQQGGALSFSKQGPMVSVLRGRETYQDLLDSGVMVEWELWPKCAAQMEKPGDNEELVYNDRKPGQLVHPAYAEVQPSFWGDDLHWEFPEIHGSELDTPPEKANGNDFEVTYTNLPEENSAFKLGEVKARFVTDRAKQAGCENPEPSDVGYFFPRSGLNHGGSPGLKSDENSDTRPNPNWFHYWMQTRANPGLPTAFVRYGGKDPTCVDARGYYSYGKAYIVICDLEDFVSWNPLAPGYYPEGIDHFGSTVRHEKQHYDNYRRWWSAGWDPTLDSDAADKHTGRGEKGSGGDLIPDLLERSVPVPKEVKVPAGTKRQFDPNLQDSFGYGLEDEHYIVYAAALRWKPGTADAEDWSCPGHQTFECGQ